MVTLVLEENGLPTYSASITSYKTELDSVVNRLAAENGALVSIVPKTFGRATYHFALFAGLPTAPKSTKSKSTKSDATE